MLIRNSTRYGAAPPPVDVPVFTSAANYSFPEGAPHSHQLTTDIPSTFAIVGGADSASGSILDDQLIISSQTYPDSIAIKVRATAISGGATADQDTVGTVTEVVAPSVNTAPVISGNTPEGAVASVVTPGTYNGTGLTITGQWYRGATPIPDANGLTYKRKFADIGFTLKYVETATNAGGSVSQDSNVLAATVNGVIARLGLRAAAADATDADRWTHFLGTDTAETTRGGYTFQNLGFTSFSSQNGAGFPSQQHGQAAATGSAGEVSVNVPVGIEVNVRWSSGSPQTGGTATSGLEIRSAVALGGVRLHNQNGVSNGPQQVWAPGGGLLDVDDWLSQAPTIPLTSPTGKLVFRRGADTSVMALRTIEVTYPEFDDFTSGTGPYYVDNALGDNDGMGTEADPWKHCPGDPGATGRVKGFEVLPGGTVYFKRGQRHRPASYTARDEAFFHPVRSGASGQPITYGAYGAGTDPAIFDGSEIVTGWAAATAVELANNPNWANVETLAIANILDRAQQICEDNTFLSPAQFPQPSDPKSFDRIYQGNDGFISLSIADFAAKVTEGANDSGGTGYKKCTLLSDTGTLNLKDRYSADAVQLAGASKIVVLRNASWLEELEITLHTPATGYIEFKLPNDYSLPPSSASNLWKFAIRYHRYDIRASGQYAYSADMTKAHCDFYSGGSERSIVRLEYGWKVNKDYITTDGISFERFGILYGKAIQLGVTSVPPVGVKLKNFKERMISNLPRNAANYSSLLGAWDFENVTITDSPRIGGFQWGADGAHINGYISRNAGRTSGYWSGEDCIIENFDLSDNDSAHGNGGSCYQNGARNIFRKFIVANHPLPFTTQKQTAGLDRSNTWEDFFMSTKYAYPGETQPIGLYVFTVGAGETNGTIQRGICAGRPSLFGASGPGAEASTGLVVRNMVFSGLIGYELTGITFENCLILNEIGGGIMDIPAKGGTVLTGVTYDNVTVWDGTITAAMQQALTKNGSAATYSQRQIGTDANPWVIPAWGAAHSLVDVRLTTTTVNRGHRALMPFTTIIGHTPVVALSLPVGQGDNNLFTYNGKGQVAFTAAPAAGTYSLVIDQVGSHPNLTGGTTKRTTIAITVV